MSGILLAVALSDLWQWLKRSVNSAHRVQYLATGLFLALIVGWLIVWPLQNTTRRLFEPADESASIMASYIGTHIPPDVRIVSGQWEVHFYGQHRFVPILDEYYNAKIAEQTQKSLPIAHFRNMSDLQAIYILDGSENRITEMVPLDELSRNYEEVFRVGEYCLYQLQPQRVPR